MIGAMLDVHTAQSQASESGQSAEAPPVSDPAEREEEELVSGSPAPPASASARALPAGPAEFDIEAACVALRDAEHRAGRACRPSAPESGRAEQVRVSVTFRPSGQVDAVSFEPPWSTPEVGACYQAAFAGVLLPAFDGEQTTVKKKLGVRSSP
jgi:hypothetical protein